MSVGRAAQSGPATALTTSSSATSLCGWPHHLLPSRQLRRHGTSSLGSPLSLSLGSFGVGRLVLARLKSSKAQVATPRA